MAPAGDWNESREQVRAEMIRLSRAHDDLRDAVQKMAMNSQVVVNEQTRILTQTINGNHIDTIQKLAEMKDVAAEKNLKIMVDINSLKVKTAIWASIGAAIVTAAIAAISHMVAK